MRTKILPLFCLFNLWAAVTFAQSGKSGHNRFNREMRAELKAYVQKNITPVMQQQRQKLEQQLSSQDKTKIRELRIAAATARKQAAIFRQNLRAQPQPGNRHLTEEQKTQLQNLRAENQKIRTEARTLAQQYNTQIQALYKEVAAPAQTWRQEMAAIVRKYTQNTAPAAPPKQARQRMLHGANRYLSEYFRPVAFLLWEVNQPINNNFTDSAIENRLYPNPVTAKATLEYVVKEKGKVTIDLLDEQGKIIRNLLTSNQELGQYFLDLDLSTFKNGLYIYKITTDSGTVTARFLKK
ncbi:T9SS type A sorting domain-containing protein [Adhaeribacter rhizoryzae]|uniref:T9SS type A sorting domain-containing protein n=1 Tax=Adhaeribacter rhizoryzae TaxID=2607907 RepID=A0A5M6DP69_9BACT|nr:T9SS type A sorting domain-containing protein [Adhaeribacter rhizoryzae]KAA5548236.1 T9SS type A sorting domain-containing protein [Adhaeribacter rhizoryzae]